MTTQNNGHDEFVVDDDAKLRCDLYKHFDSNKKAFFTGKLQFNGVLDFKDGQNFMIFLSEEDKEEIQIGPIDPKRARKSRNNVRMQDGRICIRLTPHTDNNGKTFFVGEARDLEFLNEINCKRGIFFTVFTSKPGREELQISQLNVKQKQKLKQPAPSVTEDVRTHEPEVVLN